MRRNPAVAGRFYPGSEKELFSFLDEELGKKGKVKPAPALGLVSPHAGYIYSGGVAARGFAAVEATDTVVLLGPNHTGQGTAASIMSKGRWATPMGEVEIDQELAEELKSACPTLTEDSRAHELEHSLEVQLPFLQYLNPEVKIVPITFMLRRLEEMELVGTALGEVLSRRDEPTLMVASSDMSHYEPRVVAKEKDDAAIEKVLALDPEGLVEVVRQKGISMCGFIPTTVMLYAAKILGATEAELIAYDDSGDVTGDTGSVVGYAAMTVR